MFWNDSMYSDYVEVVRANSRLGKIFPPEEVKAAMELDDAYPFGVEGDCEITPNEVGDFLDIPEYKVRFIRILENPVEFSCGIQCCGYEKYEFVITPIP